ncbi:transposase-like protein [Desulfofarcimen acetoxidans DSM 771]|uniref:Transposase-like protein n=1 Tax=Desulfofarcimen acetoxidans (strain ATCC 49208 / DSM 771 / KCTC 5769 / VKM B-1644 / 5575) TaxID=485916 RepID=C8VXG4_DESAS|nr:IS1634 family transposase [Desulfofarcimen acetoxidans]ACV61311.1 transposase-like protein [Desulfofarcimen acetoxidans DSM 771]ACV62684.1 transposase-like protein [Desulfofarcimen acetoxidans DSM 771]ACV64560.1 transposase-like protein [Desulfofarcimen acetoxidans DSM 771]ACV64719.1 transposase-like protein [Desulfofarcimen acetoxidans DSM 771]
MASIIKKKKKNQFYYYLVESARVNGKPRIVRQKYLGRAEDIAKAVEGKSDLENPKYSIVLEFGTVCALYDIAKQLGVIEIIDKYAPKREQGLSVGEYMLLAAINRVVKPVSKFQIGEWYDKTMLYRMLPAPKQSLTSQRFWDNMSLLSDSAIESFENEFTQLIVDKYNLSTDLLIYDATNFFTYIDTLSADKLPQRGHSKEKRSDLKIVGLAMMVTPDFNVPLFYDVYPGNDNDSVEFKAVIEKLKNRYINICGKPGNATLVFDKGNNSLNNMDLVMSGEFAFNVVGSLRLSQNKSLLDIPIQEYESVNSDNFRNVKAYRTTLSVYNREMTVLVVCNPELFAGQMQSIAINIEKCTLKLRVLQKSLLDRVAGVTTKGRKPTVTSVQKNVATILHGEFMSDIFDVQIYEQDGLAHLDFSINIKQFNYVKEHFLGKTVLFTDNHDWPNDKIISTYRSQYHIEDDFRQMKDTTFLGFRPIHHWTDQKIKVHAFYCVLALRLCCLLNRVLHENGLKMSINKMLSRLSDIKQVITVYPKKGNSKKDRECFSLTKISAEEKRLLEVLDIGKYALGG